MKILAKLTLSFLVSTCLIFSILFNPLNCSCYTITFKVNFNFKPLTKSLTEGTLVLPSTIAEDSEDDSDCEFVIEYVTDSEEDE